MITAVVYSESGGTYKTTLTANLGVTLSRMGLDVLLIDLDPQEGNLTSLFDVGQNRENSKADNLVKHILERPEGDFSDIIEPTDEGVDVIPSHNMLSTFTRNLEQKITFESGMEGQSRDDYPRNQLLYQLLWEREEIQEEYDAVLVDPNARAEDMLYNAIYAMRTIIAPVSAGGKGNLSLEGLKELTGGMSEQLDIEIGLACVVPTEVKQQNAHQRYLKKFRDDDDLQIPVVIGERGSMMDVMWDAKGSAYTVVEERWAGKEGEDPEPGKRKVRDREVETLQRLWKLGQFIATETFDENVNSELTLEIEEKDPITYDPEVEEESEVTA